MFYSLLNVKASQECPESPHKTLFLEPRRKTHLHQQAKPAHKLSAWPSGAASRAKFLPAHRAPNRENWVTKHGCPPKFCSSPPSSSRARHFSCTLPTPYASLPTPYALVVLLRSSSSRRRRRCTSATMHALRSTPAGSP